MKRIISVTLIMVFAFLAITSCNSNTLYSEGKGDLNIVCSNFPPFDFARVVGGEKVTVTILQDNGVDLHNYTPTSATLKALKNADIFICVGGESDESWVDDAIAAANNPDLKVIRLVDYIDLVEATVEEHHHDDEEEEGDDHDHENEDNEHDHENEDHEHDHEGDEHVWTSLKNAKILVAKIASIFGEVDSTNKAYYNTNATEYINKLDSLDAEYTAMVASAKYKTVIFADRFPFVYLMNDYQISYYAAFSGCSTDVDATFETQTKLIEKTKEYALPCVLKIDGSSASLANLVASQAGCGVKTMNSMQSILRVDIKNGVNYLDIMKSNLEVLREALN